MNPGLQQTLHPATTNILSAAVRIYTVKELEDSRIDYRTVSKYENIVRLCESTPSLFVTVHSVIFCSDITHESYALAKALLRKLGYQPKTCQVSDTVIKHIKALYDDYKTIGSVIKDDSFTNKINGADEESPAISFFFAIAEDAIKQGASDIKIYIRAGQNTSKVFFKINGSYSVQSAFSARRKDTYVGMMRAVIDYHIHKCNGDASNQFSEDVPMDEQIPFTFPGVGTIKIRMSGMPGEHGSLAVALRIPATGKKTELPSLSSLGFLPEQAELIADMMNAPFGLNLFTGPTGSGKTTAIASALMLRPDASPTITLEQPVEISILSKPSILQCPIDEDDEKRDWKAMLRQALRQDPDTLMIGEIRDAEVASTLSRAAGTGHLVLSTMHVNSVIDVPSALEHYGLPFHKIAESSFLRLLVGMRLLKGTCKYCAIPLAEADQSERSISRLQGYFEKDIRKVKVINKSGCSHCKNTGTSGRTLIAEVAVVDGPSRGYILSQRFSEWRAYLKENGWIDMKSHAELLVRSGGLCPIEAEANVISQFGLDSEGEKPFCYTSYRSGLEA